MELPATLDLDARRHTDTLQGANKRMLHVQILARVELNPKTRMTARLLKCNAEEPDRSSHSRRSLGA